VLATCQSCGLMVRRPGAAGVEPTTFRSRIGHDNHYATKPPECVPRGHFLFTCSDIFAEGQTTAAVRSAENEFVSFVKQHQD